MQKEVGWQKSIMDSTLGHSATHLDLTVQITKYSYGVSDGHYFHSAPTRQHKKSLSENSMLTESSIIAN